MVGWISSNAGRRGARPPVVIAAVVATLIACGGDSTGPDTRSAGVVSDLRATYDSAATAIRLDWTPPGGAVARYEFRYGLSAPFDWHSTASLGTAAPAVPEGKRQTAAFPPPHRGTDVWVAAKSVDPEGGRSPQGNVARVRVPGVVVFAACEWAIAGVPVPGARATVTAAREHSITTETDGTFRIDDVATGAANLRVLPGPGNPPFHTFSTTISLANDTALVVPIIEYHPARLPAFDTILELLWVEADIEKHGGALIKWHRYPVDCYVQSFSKNGVDFGAETRNAATEWMSQTGAALFRFVGAPPDTGITVSFRPPSEMGIQNGFTIHTNDAAGFPLTDAVSIRDDFGDPVRVFRVALHELGHTIRLAHVGSPGYIMYVGANLPATVSVDEADAVRLFMALPNRWDVGAYERSQPR